MYALFLINIQDRFYFMHSRSYCWLVKSQLIRLSDVFEVTPGFMLMRRCDLHYGKFLVTYFGTYMGTVRIHVSSCTAHIHTHSTNVVETSENFKTG